MIKGTDVTDSTEMTREERLAARLRDNLRRRKAQARARPQAHEPAPGANAALSKAPPES